MGIIHYRDPSSQVIVIADYWGFSACQLLRCTVRDRHEHRSRWGRQSLLRPSECNVYSPLVKPEFRPTQTADGIHDHQTAMPSGYRRKLLYRVRYGRARFYMG